jgi:uncharacterized membrane protein
MDDAIQNKKWFKMKKSLHLVVAFAVLAPAIYLYTIYGKLPETIPTHFGLDGNADDWGPKKELWLLTAILSVVSVLSYLLVANGYKIDPKKKAAENKDRLQKIAVAVVLFMAAVQVWIIHITWKGAAGNEMRFIFVGGGILFAIIGNYMANIKPNYFAGIRLPWTLENEDNWRKTHHYASRIWFIGGLLIAICSLLLPLTPSIVVLVCTTIAMAIIPAVYSYRLYKANKGNT